MLSSDLDTKTVKWLRNSLEAAVEAEVKGNEVNLSNGSLLTARKKTYQFLKHGWGPINFTVSVLHQEYLLFALSASSVCMYLNITAVSNLKDHSKPFPLTKLHFFSSLSTGLFQSYPSSIYYKIYFAEGIIYWMNCSETLLDSSLLPDSGIPIPELKIKPVLPSRT